ncbi:MAG: manganese efflux pump [Defluviitaleaceae bacterium]|nr:manganese efflux pump [Defluviitaleaceae bacterium]
MGILFLFLQTFLLVFALGVDALVCSFSYAVNKIRIPFKSMMMINVVTLFLLGAGIVMAKVLVEFLPSTLVYASSFFILFMLGMSKIFEGVIKGTIKRHEGRRHFSFSLFNLGFVLQVYAQYELADSDDSKVLSLKEAIPLAFALGFDGLSVGLSIGLMQIDVTLLLGMSFVVGMICVALGDYLGRKLSKKMSFDFSLISGLILILIAILNVI